MEKYDLIKKYKIPDVYNLLFLENELNKMQSNKYELKKIDDKDVFYFKKQMQSKNIRYFILITHFEHKVLLDRSEQKMVIENQTISNYLIENDVKYNLFFKDKKSFYVYKLINIDNDMLDSIKNYRYQMVKKFAEEEISIMISIFIIFSILAIISLFLNSLNSLIAFVFCFIINLVLIVRISFTKKFLKKIL